MGSVLRSVLSTIGVGDPTPPNTNMRCCVESILGISEFDLVRLSPSDRQAFLLDGGKGEDVFVHSKTGQVTSYGQFEVITLAELCRRVNDLPNKQQRQQQHRPTSPPPPLTTASGIDIGQLQATLKTSNAAMVQVASNFNCLENGTIRSAADRGSLVDDACRDYTQGPAAAFGALSAYLYRAHFYQGGQTATTQVVNLLKNVSHYFGLPVNGKLLLRGNEVPIGTTDEAIDEVVQEICIGLHTQCPVMFGRNYRREIFHNNNIIPNQNVSSSKTTTTTSSSGSYNYPIIDQVFTASINLGQVGTISKACLTAFDGDYEMATNHMVRVLLRASYEATYAAAILQQRKELYLTLVGGGSFRNPIPIIVEELERAHHKWIQHPASVLEKNQLCLFSTKDQQQVEQYLNSRSWDWRFSKLNIQQQQTTHE